MSSNTNESHKWVDVEEAHGGTQHLDTYGGDQGGAGDTWKSTGVSGFTPSSDPNSHNYSGQDTTVSVYNVSASGNTMTFDFGLTNTPPAKPALLGPADLLQTNDNTPVFTLTTTDVNLDTLRYIIEVSNDNFTSIFRAYNQVANATGWNKTPYNPGDTAAYTVQAGSSLPDGTYQWRARAWDGANWSFNSNVRSFTVDTVFPISVTNLINADAAWATSTSVTLTLAATEERTGIAGMQFSNDGATWSAWEAYAVTKAWTLTAGDGGKTVYFRVKDGAGNVAGWRSDGIVLDSTVPSFLSVSINAGAATTRSKTVTLLLGAFDGLSGLDSMSFSENGGPWSAWEAWNTSKTLNLTATGVRTISLRVRDTAGNIGSGANDAIIYDTSPPTGLTISINGAAAATNDRNVALVLNASDPLAGLSSMRFSNDGVVWSAWMAWSNSSTWTLDDFEGGHRVYFQVNDTAGNIAEPVSATIIYDATAPTGIAIGLAGGGTATNLSPALVLVSALDVHAGLAAMRFSINGVTWSSWAAFSSNATVGLGGQGPVLLRIQVRDSAGNVGNGSLALVYDTTPPVPTAASSSATTSSRWIILAIDAGDPLAGPGRMRFWMDGGSPTPWESFATAKALLLPDADAAHTITIEVEDLAGNTGSVDVPVTLDRIAPTITGITVGSGSGWTNSTIVLVTVTASDATSGAGWVRWSIDGVVWSAWAPLASAAFQVVLRASDGAQSIYIEVLDDAGNTGGPAEAPVRLDTRSPDVIMTVNNGTKESATAAITLWFDASGDATPASLELSLSSDGASWSPWEPLPATRTWVLGGAGSSRPLNLQIRDPAGNVLTIADSVIIDQDAPVVTASFAEGSVTNLLEVRLLVDSSQALDADRIRVSVGSGPFSAWTPLAPVMAILLPGPDGDVAVQVEVQDRAGNVGTTSATITLDTAAPVDIRLDLGGATIGKRDLKAVVTATDSSFLEGSLSEDGIAWSTWFPIDGTRVDYRITGPEGPNAIYARVRDAAGNVGGPVRSTITLDLTGPAVIAITPDDGALVGSLAFPLTVRALPDPSGVASIAVSTDGGKGWESWEDFTGSAEVSVASSGEWEIAVRLRDGAGNIGPTTVITLTITPASSYSVTIAAPGARATVAGPIQVTGSAVGSGITKIETRVDGGKWTPAVGTNAWSWHWDTSSLSDGQHTIEARATDGFGFAESETRTVTVLNHPPAQPSPLSTFTDPAGLLQFVILLVVAIVAGAGTAAALRQRPASPPPASGGSSDEPVARSSRRRESEFDLRDGGGGSAGDDQASGGRYRTTHQAGAAAYATTPSYADSAGASGYDSPQGTTGDMGSPVQSTPQAAVESAMAPADAGPKWVRVKKAVPCTSCYQQIAPGETALRCTCKAPYHEACAQQAGSCVNCGTQFNLG